jgi:hypothetical protein
MAEISVEDINRLSMAAAAGRPFPSNVEDNSSNRTLFADLIEEVKNAGNVVVYPASELAEDDKYDVLIDSTYGPGGFEALILMPREEFDAKMKAEEDMREAVDKRMSLVAKADGERRFTLGPMYVPNQLDAHNEWTDPDELQTALWEYVKSGDRRIRLQHNREIVAGEWVEAMTMPFPISVPMMKSNGDRSMVDFPENTVFMGVIWEPWAWELVKSGKLRGYSIGGKAARVLVDLEN